MQNKNLRRLLKEANLMMMMTKDKIYCFRLSKLSEKLTIEGSKLQYCTSMYIPPYIESVALMITGNSCTVIC